jgi:acid phosphatase
VFELWELPAASSASSSAPVHAVRVLYNREELPLPGSPPGKVVELGHFRGQVLGSFLLSEQDHARACRIQLDHATSLPQPAGSMSSPQQDSE